ncbi:tol-pal system YbgF family protein [Candidatus Latescibacterota bacterium]
MRNHDVLETKAAMLVSVLFFALAFMIAGCSQSADELYSEGKKLILTEENFDGGMELLLRFEKKFPEDPRSPEVMLALATGYQNLKKFDEAVEYFNRLIEKYPDSDEAYKGMFLLGYMFYEEIKDEDMAKSTFDRFIEFYPDSELTVSARVLVENIGLPVEEWSIVRELKLPSEQ